MEEILLTIFILITSSVCSAWTQKINCTAPQSIYFDYTVEMKSETFPKIRALITAKKNQKSKIFSGVGYYTQEFDFDTGKKMTGFNIHIDSEDLSSANTFSIMFEDKKNQGSGLINSIELTGKNEIISSSCNR